MSASIPAFWRGFCRDHFALDPPTIARWWRAVMTVDTPHTCALRHRLQRHARIGYGREGVAHVLRRIWCWVWRS
jgi:hypothetical protein